MNTKELIIEKTLNLFNSKGIEYTGMRELAAALNMRVSNITYYFPTKDDLVFELSNQLRLLNNTTIEASGFESIASFLEMYRKIFYNQYKYRCLLLSFVHLVTQNKLLAKNYSSVESRRKAQLEKYMHALIENGHLKKKND